MILRELVSPNFHAPNDWNCMGRPQVTWDTVCPNMPLVAHAHNN